MAGQRLGGQSRDEVVQAAIDAARVFVSTSGTTGEAADVLVEIGAYASAYGEPHTPVQRLGKSRTRAVIGLMLWEVTRGRPKPGAGFCPADSGIQVAPPAIRKIGGATGAFIAGSRVSETVLAACTETLVLAEEDRRAARVVADLLIGAYGVSDRRLSDDASAAILRTVARVRAHDEDPTTIGIALAALADHRDHWLTVDTVQIAVRVASAAERWDLAGRLYLASTDLLSADFRVPSGRERHIERIEYLAWSHHQQSGTLRRKAESQMAADPLYAGLDVAGEAERRFEDALEHRLRGEPGDVSTKWGFYFSVRRAELQLSLARHWQGAAASYRRRAGMEARDAAAAVADEDRVTGEALIPLMKLDLLGFITDHEWEAASEVLWRMHELGWPIRRSVAPVAGLVDREPAERSRSARDNHRRHRLRRARPVVVGGG